MKRKHKQHAAIKIEQLRNLEPIASLSEERLEELIPLVYVEKLVIGGNLFREGDIDNQTIYLLKGDVQLSSSDGSIYKNLSEHSDEARFPLDDSQPRQATCSALTRVDALRIDNSVLDYMMMWDQMAVSESTAVAEIKKEEDTKKESIAKSDDTVMEEIKPVPSAENRTIEAAEVNGEPDKIIQPSEKTENKPSSVPLVASQEGSEKQQEKIKDTPPVEEVQAEQVKVAEQSAEYKKSQESEALEIKPDIIPAEEVATPDDMEEEPEGENDRSWIRKMRHIMAFKSMPPANIKRLLECMESVEVKKGETIVKQGTPGDYYYVLTDGKAKVTRLVELATLEPGRSFGEEALISDDIRNASITMETDGVVMRLSKKDFSQLLQEPLLHRLSPGDARLHIAKGAKWLDVRHAREYQHSHLPEAINIPLHELRTRIDELSPDIPIVCYCSTGRRSAAAAFLLAQKGFKASVLNGGVRVMAQDLKRNQ